MSSIKFTSAFWHEIETKLLVYEKLKDNFINIDIKNFSEIDKLIIIFQAFPKDYRARKVLEYKIQRRKTKTLELYLILDYERIMQGTDPENLLHIKEVFLKGCETFLKPMKEFNYIEFETKIKEIL